MTHTGYINGAFVNGEGASFVVENPSDETVVAEINGLSAGQVEKALAAARDSFDSGTWSGLTMKQRAETMLRYSEALKKRADKLRELAIAEAGCPVSSTVMGAQVHAPLRMTGEIIDMFLTLPEFDQNPLPLHERVNPYFVVQSLKLYRPLGVVSAISAYNVPFYTAFWKVVPALMAGNSVILRPNPLTPLSSMIFAEAADEAGLPKGVMNVIIENGLEGGLAMTTDERVDMVSFTGSCVVGAKVPLILTSRADSAEACNADTQNLRHLSSFRKSRRRVASGAYSPKTVSETHRSWRHLRDRTTGLRHRRPAQVQPAPASSPIVRATAFLGASRASPPVSLLLSFSR